MIGSGGFGRVFEGTRKFDGKKVFADFAELYKHFALACIKTYLITHGLILRCSNRKCYVQGQALECCYCY